MNKIRTTLPECTTSNIGVSIISLHDTPRLHTLKRVIRNLIVWRTYNESSKLTLAFRVCPSKSDKKQKVFVAKTTIKYKIILQLFV